jgi:hypothetical protein
VRSRLAERTQGLDGAVEASLTCRPFVPSTIRPPHHGISYPIRTPFLLLGELAVEAGLWLCVELSRTILRIVPMLWWAAKEFSAGASLIAVVWGVVAAVPKCSADLRGSCSCAGGP